MKLLCAAIVLLALAGMPPKESAASDLPWQRALAPSAPMEKGNAIEAKASVVVSDGLTYDTFVSWRDNERAIFHRQYPDRRITAGRDGEYYWGFDGEKQSELSPFMGFVILGHQFHAFLLRTQDFISAQPIMTQSELCKCLVAAMTLKTGQPISLHFDQETQRPMIQISDDGQGNEIRTTYTDWRDHAGYHLPFGVVISHAGRDFVYSFHDINLSQNTEYASYRAPFHKLTGEQQLIRLHRNTIDAHISSDVSLMADNWADEMLFVGRGRISEANKDASVATMGRSLQSRKHSIYLDLERPRVQLSDDETMGQIYARVRAEGHTLNQDGSLGAPFEFTSAWQSTFKKIDGRWQMVSNTSNFE